MENVRKRTEAELDACLLSVRCPPAEKWQLRSTCAALWGSDLPAGPAALWGQSSNRYVPMQKIQKNSGKSFFNDLESERDAISAACLCSVYTGTYMLRNQLGIPCIKATMGVEYIVVEQKVRGCDLLSNVPACGYFSALFCLACVFVSASLYEVLHVGLNCKKNCKRSRVAFTGFTWNCSCVSYETTEMKRWPV